MIPLGLLPEIKLAYERDCVSMVDIAGRHGVSRQAIHKFLRRHGVETRNGIATRRDVECSVCGVVFNVSRSRFRRYGVMRFCNPGCRDVFIEGNSRVNRQKQRMSRRKVAEVFDLSAGDVVHHIDADHYNTTIENLMVFSTNAEHISYHHQLRLKEHADLIGLGYEITVKPIWAG